MAVLGHVMRYGQLRLGRRLARSVPWIGTALALVAVGAAIRRKGVVGGTVDTALNAVPVLGAAKGAVEAFRGRDFIPDRRQVSRGNGHGRPDGLRVSES
jgi:hypothetical protein